MKKYNVGDKLTCRKPKRGFFFSKKDKNLSFTDGKVYMIEDLNKDGSDSKFYILSPNGESEYVGSMPKHNILYIADDKDHMRFLDLLVAYNQIDIFLTESELRKEKLKRINEKSVMY
jgi:translation elongation factor P/translation initiation factor 5A